MNFNFYAKCLRKLFTDVIEVYENKKFSDLNGITKSKWVKVMELRGRLSFFSSSNVSKGVYSDTDKEVKLFVEASVEIKENSRIRVLKSGVSYFLECSGICQSYDTHREYNAVAVKRFL